jgi:putative transposase
MPRRKRPDLPGVPVHVIQRAAERNWCFLVEEDRERSRAWLAEAARREGCAIHAYVLMRNHVHLLLTPLDAGAMPRTMHSLGSRYVRYFNERHGRGGVLWERRYRSCFIDSDEYLRQCHRYIELNPVRAGIVAHPGDYRWSSFGHLARGQPDDLVTVHPVIAALGRDARSRQAAYGQMVGGLRPDDDWSALRLEAARQGAYGSEAFRANIGKASGLGDLSRRVGRPPL